MRRGESIRVGLAASSLAIAIGCGGGPCGNAEDRDVPLSELPCATPGTGAPWASHPFPPIDDEECFWLEFRGCSVYRFENPLGRVPAKVIGYTSFDADGSFSTVASGNSFIVQEATDTEVTVRNAQNQLFYLRLVLE